MNPWSGKPLCDGRGDGGLCDSRITVTINNWILVKTKIIIYLSSPRSLLTRCAIDLKFSPVAPGTLEDCFYLSRERIWSSCAGNVQFVCSVTSEKINSSALIYVSYISTGRFKALFYTVKKYRRFLSTNDRNSYLSIVQKKMFFDKSTLQIHIANIVNDEYASFVKLPRV